MHDIIVVGASLAGVTAADTLRGQGFDGHITVIGDEPHPPYARPPLSKGVLAGTEPPESVYTGFPQDVTFRYGVTATALDARNGSVMLAGGEQLKYDGLVIATGSRPRRLAHPGQRGELVLRSIDDCLTIRRLIKRSPSVLVVGAGFLGMEIASTCRQAGLTVTVVDQEPPLQRVIGAYLANLFIDSARTAGVAIRLAPGGVRLEGDPVSGVRFADGSVIRADLVITAAGDLPNSEWTGRTGPLVIDERCRLTRGIVAAGDVAAMQSMAGGEISRTPHWNSAVEQARVAAAALLHGDNAPALATTPYFWTEGFGLEVKLCGSVPPVGTPIELDGSIRNREVVLQWADEHGQPVAAATVNHRMPLARLKRLATGTPTLVRN